MKSRIPRSSSPNPPSLERCRPHSSIVERQAMRDAEVVANLLAALALPL
jgi:hypothetical protein